MNSSCCFQKWNIRKMLPLRREKCCRRWRGLIPDRVDCLRGSDTVSRQGGDEFVVLLSEVEHSEDAAITARKMLQAVAGAHSRSGGLLTRLGHSKPAGRR